MPKWIAAIALLLLIAVGSNSGRLDEPPEESYETALSYLRDGDFDASLAVTRRAAGRWDRHVDSEWHWRFRVLEAEIALEQNQASGVEALIDEGAEFGERFAEIGVRRRALKARKHVRVSEFDRAAKHIEEAERIALAARRDDLLAEVYVMRGQILGRQGRIDEAERAFNEAQIAAGRTRDAYWQAAAATNLGLLRMMRSRCDQAIPLFEEARKISLRLGADRTVTGADNNLGMCYANLGDFDKALEYREEALRLARPSARLADVLGEMGTLHLAQGNTDKAIQSYRRALDTAKRFGALPEAAIWAGNLASALTAAGDLDTAEKALQEAVGLKPEPRSLMELELEAAKIAYGRQRFEEARTNYQRIIASAPEKVDLLWQSHAGLARILRDEGNFEQAHKSFEAAIRVIESNRSDLNRTEHKLTLLSSLIKFYQDYVDSLMMQNMPIRALEVVESSRARVLAERMSQPVDGRHALIPHLREVARDSGSILLSYWLAPERSFLWVVTPKEILHFELPPAAVLSQLVTEYRAFIEDAVRDPLQTEAEAGRRLYEALVRPVEDLLPRHSPVTIIPDGPLHHLAFDTLPVYDAAAPRYWGDDVIVAIAPSLSVFRGAVRKSVPNKEALIIGDPVPADPNYPPLRHAAVEISNVSARLPGRARIIRGVNAQPSVYKAANPAGFGIIHIAAHAEANRLNPLESSVILSPGPEGFKLSARTVAEVPLSADMVMLSACRTSGARAYAGEGLVGLAWAFLHAGSRSVVAGLWDVADESTAALVDHLYAELAAGGSVPEALRRAKLSLRQTAYSKPYYWGPFQCYVR